MARSPHPAARKAGDSLSGLQDKAFPVGLTAFRKTELKNDCFMKGNINGMKVSLWAAIAMAAGCLCIFSCGKQDAGDKGIVVLKDSTVPVAFVASLDGERETKATPVVTLSSFQVGATQGAVGSETSAWNDVTFSNDRGVYVGNRFWPEDMDPVYHFYASNLSLVFDADGTCVNASNGTDVVCAYLASSTYMSPNALAFQHVFARLGEVTVTAASGYTLSDVSFTLTPKTGGTYNLRTGNGRTDGTGWSNLSSGSPVGIAPSSAGSRENDIFLVPGSYTLSCSWVASEDTYTKSFLKDVAVNIVGGKVNTISAVLGGDVSQIDFGVSLAEWSDSDVDAGTFPID